MFRVVYKGSLSDAEVLEDVIEGLLAGDGTTGDVSKNLENLTEVFGYEVGGEGRGETGENTFKGLMSMNERVVVAAVGDDDSVLCQLRDVCESEDDVFQLLDALTKFGADAQLGSWLQRSGDDGADRSIVLRISGKVDLIVDKDKGLVANAFGDV